VEPDAADEAPAAFDVLSDDKVSPAQLGTRPGCILAPCATRTRSTTWRRR
jgi:hypothetical protein